MRSPSNVAIVGVTGAVGRELLSILEQRDFPLGDLRLLASARSAGKRIPFKRSDHIVEQLTPEAFEDVDIALFSAGGSISREYAPIAAAAGCIVVDNSSAFRMDPATPLVVPEINPDDVQGHTGVIANANCSTIIMNLPLWPLHRELGVKRVVVSTYQSASGAGAAAMSELEQQARDWMDHKPLTQDVLGRPYIFNAFSHNSEIDPHTGYNTEETKMIRETQKIFHDADIGIAATCVRVPVLRAHCESINVSFDQPTTEERVREVLAASPGVRIVDDRAANKHPEPIDATGEDDVLVGRIRPDLSQDEGYGFEMFVSGDQLRKGAALNAVQIADLLLQEEKVGV